MEKDLYAIVGLDKKCTHSEIKKIYRKAILVWHPNKGPYYPYEYSEEQIEALQILINDELKKIYDEKGYAEVKKYKDKKNEEITKFIEQFKNSYEEYTQTGS